MSRELHKAAAENDLSTLVDLLDKGEDINSVNPYNGTALMIAAKRGHGRIVEALLSRGGDPCVRLCPPRDPNQSYTALHTAAQEGHDSIVTMLLESGADVNAATGYGETPLISAAVYGQRSTVKLLLRNGANPKAKTCEGKTAASYALQKGHFLTWLALQ